MKTLLLLVTALCAATDAAAQRPVPSHEQTPPARQPAREVARVNGVAIASDRLDAAVNALVPLQSFHRQLDAEKLAAYRRQALESLVDEELEYQRAIGLGLEVAAASVEAGMADLAKRYASQKAFDDARMRAGVSLADLRADVRRRLLVQGIHNREVTSRCQVSADEASQYFQANPDRFMVPEQLHVYAVTIGVAPSSTPAQWAEARARAESALRQIRNGASFEETARAYSTDKSKDAGGDMGFVHRGSLSDEFEAALRDLAPGLASDVVQTLYGYHIVRVGEVRPPERKSFAEVGARLRADLTAKRCEDTNAAWLRGLRSEATIVLAALQ